jgi:hypothetical protein
MGKIEINDTYVLPKSYNCDNMVLYAVDPNWLFAFWEISNNKKDDFIEDFGKNLWEKSVPILRITNITRNESFNIRINDFSDNWYINIPYSDCIYKAEIGRNVSGRFFVSLVSSNCTYAPSETASSSTKVLFANYKNVTDICFPVEWDKADVGIKLDFQLKDIALPSSRVPVEKG